MPRPFPEGFRWGSATAAHQIEGGNWNNDWWLWEHTAGSGCAEPSGDACDSWHRWAEDVALCADLGLDNYRFSIEWSRIEPEPGEWSTSAIGHDRRQRDAMLDAGVDPVVTFHHFTTPRWVVAAGGWTEPATSFGARARSTSRTSCRPWGTSPGPSRPARATRASAARRTRCSSMGYERWPVALAATIRRAGHVTSGEVPIVVTENGIGTTDDEQRIRYVTAALAGVLVEAGAIMDRRPDRDGR